MAIIDVTGSMAGSAEVLRVEITHCLASGRTGVVINLEHASYIDSTWLGAIVQTFVKLAQSDLRLKLLNAPPRLMDLFVLTHLSKIFDIFTEEQDEDSIFRCNRRRRVREQMFDVH